MPPKTDLDDEIKFLQQYKTLLKSLITACHDISDGGLLISIIEMCLSKNIGFNFSNFSKAHKILFGEDQSRYLVTVKDSNLAKVNKFLINNNIYFKNYGKFDAKNQTLKFPDKSSIKLHYIRNIRKMWESEI